MTCNSSVRTHGRLRLPTSIVKNLRRSESCLRARIIKAFRYNPNFVCMRARLFNGRRTWTIIDLGMWPSEIDQWEQRRARLEKQSIARQKSFRRAAYLVSALEVLKILVEHPEGVPLLKEDIFKRADEAGNEFLRMLHSKVVNEQEKVK